MNYKNLVLGTLSQEAFVLVNKNIAKRIGFLEAGLLGELISTHKYAEERGQFYEQGEKGPWFYLTQTIVEERLGIKRKEHETAIKNLVKSKAIEKKRMGLPAKSYYMINWKNIVEILEGNTAEPAPLTDCTKRTNKEVRNVQTGMDESYKQDCTKGTNIHIYKKDIQERDIKNIYKNFDDDEKEPFRVNAFAYQEFVNEFNQNFPGKFSNELFNRIFEQMHIQHLEVITYDEARKQAVYMLERERQGEIIGDYAAYFVGGIKRKQTSKEDALAKRKLKKAEEDSRKKKEQEEKDRITKMLRGEPLEERPVPFYNWLEQ